MIFSDFIPVIFLFAVVLFTSVIFYTLGQIRGYKEGYNLGASLDVDVDVDVDVDKVDYDNFKDESSINNNKVLDFQKFLKRKRELLNKKE